MARQVARAIFLWFFVVPGRNINMPRGVPTDPVELGQRLKYVRHGLRRTQSEMADHLAISISHYSKLEIGTTGMSKSLAYMICREFGVERNWLLTGNGEPPEADAARFPPPPEPAQLREVETAYQPEPAWLTDTLIERIVKIVLDETKQEAVARFADELQISQTSAWALVIRETLRADG